MSFVGRKEGGKEGRKVEAVEAVEAVEVVEVGEVVWQIYKCICQVFVTVDRK